MPEVNLDDVVVNTEPEIKEEDIKEAAIQRPLSTSPLWHDFIMSQFDEAEVDNNGYPRVSGLRRLAELHLGPIVSSTPSVITDVNGRSCIIHTVHILFREDEEQYAIYGLTPRVFAEIADATPDNVNSDVISKHLPATASTRAEARALRKALKLRVLSSEEANSAKGVAPHNVSNDTGWIEPGQETVLNAICKRCNINLWRYINSRGFLVDGKPYTTVEKIPYDQAVKMLRTLTKIQNKTIEVPPDITGYDAGWKNKIQGAL